MSKALPASGEILFQGVTLNEFSPAYDLSNANIGAAILRATSGEDYTDAALAANAEAARQNNLRLGFYHYLTAEDEAGARAQARFFATAISPSRATPPGKTGWAGSTRIWIHPPVPAAISPSAVSPRICSPSRSWFPRPPSPNPRPARSSSASRCAWATH